MNPMDPSNYLPEDSARHIAEQRQRMHEADHVVRYAHSRTGMLARFLQRMADGIDPTGEARRMAPRR
ncbi:MAG: hypothetical protein E6I23_15010 [Chloroflexi bacterium]|nr:MAG: hypothetical protein AUH32_07935 [Actinobacteria bacterium 13_1_40CM_66_12]TMF41656.1 MAG: hypothetical protein E6I23_15010 [Chloroflexota bacterium]